jgi:hypothetical protein
MLQSALRKLKGRSGMSRADVDDTGEHGLGTEYILGSLRQSVKIHNQEIADIRSLMKDHLVYDEKQHSEIDRKHGEVQRKIDDMLLGKTKLVYLILGAMAVSGIGDQLAVRIFKLLGF